MWDQYLMDYPEVAPQGAPMPEVLPWDEPEERALAREPAPVAPPPSQKFGGSIPVSPETDLNERGFTAPKKESLTRSNLRQMVMEEIGALNEAPPEALTQAQAVVDADNAKKPRVNETLTRWQRIIK
jgi:hypothetical protein